MDCFPLKIYFTHVPCHRLQVERQKFTLGRQEWGGRRLGEAGWACRAHGSQVFPSPGGHEQLAGSEQGVVQEGDTRISRTVEYTFLLI